MDGMKKIQAAMLAFVMVAVCTFALAAGGQDADADTINPDTSWYDAGKDSFEIGTAEQLAGLAELVNEGNTFKDKTVKLTKDVTLSGEWTPIGNGSRSGSSFTGNSFQGTFDGNWFYIDGLKITTITGDNAAGFFGIVAGGTIANVFLRNVNINVPDDELVGAIAGAVCEDGAVKGCAVGTVSDKSSIVGYKGVGGVVGRVLISGSVIDCDNFASVTIGKTGGYNSGGIVGAAYYSEVGESMTISECLNFGAINGNTGAGGIVGLSAANVRDCENIGSVVSNSGGSVGGIVGEQKACGSIKECINFGSVTCTGTSKDYGTGGIVGWVRYDEAKTSGELNYKFVEMIKVEGCVNLGDVVSSGNNAGGIIGMTYNWAYVGGNVNLAGKVESTEFAAGITTQQNETYTRSDVGAGITVEDNVSTTDKDSIKAKCTDRIVYINVQGSVTASGNGYDLPSGFVTPVKPEPVTPDKVPEEVESEDEKAVVVISEAGTVKEITMKTSNGSVTIKNGECNSGVVSVEITVSTEPVVTEAVQTFDVTISRIVSSDITMTFDVSIPSGKVPKVFSYKDGEVVEEKVVSYTSSSVTIQTDHNTPFSIVLKSAPVSYDDDDDGGQYPWQPQQQSTSQQDDSKVLIIAVAAAAAAVMAMAALMAFKKI